MPDEIKFIPPSDNNPTLNQMGVFNPSTYEIEEPDTTLKDQYLKDLEITDRVLEDMPLDKDPKGQETKDKLLKEKIYYESYKLAQDDRSVTSGIPTIKVSNETLQAYQYIGETFDPFASWEEQARVAKKFDKLNEEIKANSEGRLTDEQRERQEKLKAEQSIWDVWSIQIQRLGYSFSAGSENYNPKAIYEWADHFTDSPLEYSINSLIKGELTEEGKKDIAAQEKFIEENPIYKTGDEKWWHARGLLGDLVGNVGFAARAMVDWKAGEYIIKGVKLLNNPASRAAIKDLFIKQVGKQVAAAAAREVALTEASAAIGAVTGGVGGVATEVIGTTANAGILAWDIWKSGVVGKAWDILKGTSSAIGTATSTVGNALKLKRAAQSLIGLQKVATLGKAASTMSKAALWGKIAEHTKTVILDAAVSSSEAAVEAEYAYREFVKENKNLYENAVLNPNTGKAYTERDVLSMAEDVRTRTYQWNFPILMVSNLFSMGSVMRLSKIPKYLEHIPIAIKGIKTGKYLVGEAVSKYSTKQVLKTIGYNYFLKGALAEGFEEVAQLHVSNSSKNFYKNKLLTGKDMTQMELFNSGLKTWLGTEEGFENFISGAAMGIILPGARGIFTASSLKGTETGQVDSWKEAFTLAYLGYSKKSTQNAVDKYNKASSLVSTMIRHQNILSDKSALKEADEVGAMQNYHDGIMTNAILLHNLDRSDYFLDSLEESSVTLSTTEDGRKFSEMSDQELENYFTKEKEQHINDRLEILFGSQVNEKATGDIVVNYKKAKTAREKADALTVIADTINNVAADTKKAVKIMKDTKAALDTDYEINSIDQAIHSIYGRFGKTRKTKAQELMGERIKKKELSQRMHNDLIEQVAYVNYMQEHSGLKLKEVEEKVNEAIDSVYNSLSSLDKNKKIKDSQETRYSEIKTMFDFLKSDNVEGYIEHLNNKIETIKALKELGSKEDLAYYERSRDSLMAYISKESGLTKREGIAKHMIHNAAVLINEIEVSNKSDIIDAINALDSESKEKKGLLKELEQLTKAKLREDYIKELESQGLPFDESKMSKSEKGKITKEVNKRYLDLVDKQNKFNAGENVEDEFYQAAVTFRDILMQTSLYKKMMEERYEKEELEFLDLIQTDNYFGNLASNLGSFLRARIYNQFAIKEARALSNSEQRRKLVEDLTATYLEYVESYINQKTTEAEQEAKKTTITVLKDGVLQEVSVELNRDTRNTELNNIDNTINNLDQINQEKEKGLLDILDKNELALAEEVKQEIIDTLKDSTKLEKTLTLLSELKLPETVIAEIKDYIEKNPLLKRIELEEARKKLDSKEFVGTSEDVKNTLNKILKDENKELMSILSAVTDNTGLEAICTG